MVRPKIKSEKGSTVELLDNTVSAVCAVFLCWVEENGPRLAWGTFHENKSTLGVRSIQVGG